MVLSILIFLLLGGFQIPCCLVDLKIQEYDPMVGDRVRKGEIMRVTTESSWASFGPEIKALFASFKESQTK